MSPPLARLAAAIAWVLAALAAAAPAAGQEGGAAVYRRHCAACHGEKGDARSLARDALSTRPRDFTAPGAARELTREYMIAIVRDGRPHKAMVGRKTRLDQDEIEAVVDYIRAELMRR